MTIQQAINRVKSLQRLPDAAVEIMREEVPHPGHSKGYSTGALRDSIHKIEISPNVWSVGVSADHAKYVRWGRRAMSMPRDALHPGLYPFRSKDGSFVAWNVRGVEPNNFIGRTAARVRSLIYASGERVNTFGNYPDMEDSYDDFNRT